MHRWISGNAYHHLSSSLFATPADLLDAIHLLKRHDPGNQLHVVSEVQIPGGNIDYFVVSTHRGEVRDYLAIEIQALDTTGTVWPSRQQVIDKLLEVPAELPKANSYGMNWKMTAKTILVQLHHIDLTSRHSTTAVGIERVLGLRHDAELSEDELTARIRAKISDTTLLTI